MGFFLLSTASTLGSGVAEHYMRQAEPGISQVFSPGTLTILSYWHTLKHTHPDTLLTLSFPSPAKFLSQEDDVSKPHGYAHSHSDSIALTLNFIL